MSCNNSNRRGKAWNHEIHWRCHFDAIFFFWWSSAVNRFSWQLTNMAIANSMFRNTSYCVFLLIFLIFLCPLCISVSLLQDSETINNFEDHSVHLRKIFFASKFHLSTNSATSVTHNNELRSSQPNTGIRHTLVSHTVHNHEHAAPSLIIQACVLWFDEIHQFEVDIISHYLMYQSPAGVIVWLIIDSLELIFCKGLFLNCRPLRLSLYRSVVVLNEHCPWI